LALHNGHADLFLESADLDPIERGFLVASTVLIVHNFGQAQQLPIELSFVSPLQLVRVALGLAWVDTAHMTT
jgi:hypothetical protein